MSPTGGGRLGTVHKALDVLERLGSYPEGAGLQQLSSDQGLPKASMHRLLQSLLRKQLVIKDSVSGRYRLGPGVLALAAR